MKKNNKNSKNQNYWERKAWTGLRMRSKVPAFILWKLSSSNKHKNLDNFCKLTMRIVLTI